MGARTGLFVVGCALTALGCGESPGAPAAPTAPSEQPSFVLPSAPERFAADLSRFAVERSGPCGYQGLSGGLAGACFPRCSAETTDAYYRCDGNSICGPAALMNDDTPELSAGELRLDCGRCVELQEQSCYALICPDLAPALEACRSEYGPEASECNAALSALANCARDDMAALWLCLDQRVQRACLQ